LRVNALWQFGVKAPADAASDRDEVHGAKQMSAPLFCPTAEIASVRIGVGAAIGEAEYRGHVRAPALES
jgi:hypothetical protein